MLAQLRHPHRPLGLEAVYEPAPPRQPGQNGRPPLKGRRLPALKTLLDLPTVSWATVSAAWYDGTTRTLGLTSQTAVWYRSGKPPVPLRWVLVRDPQGEFTPQALLCTDPSADPTQILEWFVLRWQLEVISRRCGRIWAWRPSASGRTGHRRTTPILMGLFSWTTLAAHLPRINVGAIIGGRGGTTAYAAPTSSPTSAWWMSVSCRA